MTPDVSDLNWDPQPSGYLGCIGACLSYLGRGHGLPWLYGASGLAFCTDMGAGGSLGWEWPCLGRCETAPGLVSRLSRNMGFTSVAVSRCRQCGSSTAPGDLGAAGRELVESSLDEGFPCVAWLHRGAEFRVVRAYDANGVRVVGPRGLESHAPWRDLGADDSGWVHIESVRPCAPAAPERAVREAIAAVRGCMDPHPHDPRMGRGPAALLSWAHAVERGPVDAAWHLHGARYWAACRWMAVEFLAEAGERLPDRVAPLLREAAANYSAVARELATVAERGAEAPVENGLLRDEEAAAPLRLAWQADRAAYSVLGRIERALSRSEPFAPAATAFTRVVTARAADGVLPLASSAARPARSAAAG